MLALGLESVSCYKSSFVFDTNLVGRHGREGCRWVGGDVLVYTNLRPVVGG